MVAAAGQRRSKANEGIICIIIGRRTGPSAVRIQCTSARAAVAPSSTVANAAASADWHASGNPRSAASSLGVGDGSQQRGRAKQRAVDEGTVSQHQRPRDVLQCQHEA